MFRRCPTTPLPVSGVATGTALDINIPGVYPELSINFQYGIRAGLKHAGITPEGY
jgi:hypothetical protein